MKLLGSYKNGNYIVSIFDDGTKMRYNNLSTLIPDTVESFDFKITNMCDVGCAFCHENSTPTGAHGDILNYKFWQTLHPYTEIAVGGGNPLSHPDLIPFLQMCKDKKFIPSMTVNQIHFEKDYSLIQQLVNEKLIYGLGISLTNPTQEFIEKVKPLQNAVLHVINGVITEEQLNAIKNQNLKVLILGYKEVRRGENLYHKEAKLIEGKKTMLKEALPKLIEEGAFKVLSFDNLALNQLHVKELLPQEQWEQFYMGDDGMDGELTSATMFIDGVTGLFAVNSCSMDRHPVMDTVEEMYQFLKARMKKENND